MSEAQTMQPSGWRAYWARPIVRLLALSFVSGIGGYFVGQWLAEYDVLAAYDPMIRAAIARDGWWLIAGWATTALFGILGMILTIGSLRDGWIRSMMKLEPGETVGKPRRMLRIAGIGMAAYAVLIALFLVPGIDPVAGVVIGVAAFALVTGLFFWGTQVSDELQQAAQNEAIVWSFIVFEAVLVGWALLNHFGFAGPLKPLAVVVLMTLIYLAAAMVAAFKRGLDQ
jgi:hypothetical protein